MVLSIPKKLLAAILVAGSLSTAHAQVQFGIKGGLTIAELLAGKNQTTLIRTYPQTVQNTPRTNINVGFFLDAKINKRWSVQPELMYNNQGGYSKPSQLYQSSANETYKFNYVALPVLLKYHTTYGLYVGTGPMVSYLLKAKIWEVGVGDAHTVKYSVTSDYNKIDASWALAVGYVSPINLGLDVRYNYGLTNINKSGTDASTYPKQNGTVRNSSVQIGIFYIFGKNKLASQSKSAE